MRKERTTTIELIPIEQIAVVNPRARGKVKFKQIIDSIANLGLKKPITVAPRRTRNGAPKYDLVCGQGRLEAFQVLGQARVPAFVVQASKDELMLMSLAENLARRVRSAPELMAGIAALKDQGYTFAQIAKKTDLGVTYVRGIMRLLNKGEGRLLRAVEREQIPISIAVTIASSDEADVQRALADAYARNALRGRDLMKARRVIEVRRVRGKGLGTTGRRTGSSLNGETLVREYEKETARQRLLIKQAKVCETRLLFVVASLRRLLDDTEFVSILREQALDEIPQHLSQQIFGAGKEA